MNIIRHLSLRSMRQNKSTTLVTILGIIMSLALITGLFIFANSLLDFFNQQFVENEGDAHIVFHQISDEQLKNLPDQAMIEKQVQLNILGMELNSPDAKKPPTTIYGFNPEQAEQTVRFNLKSGRMPQAAGEAIISDEVNFNRQTPINLGDTVTLDLVKTKDYTHYSPETEYTRVKDKPSVTVVGISNNPLRYPMIGPAVFIYQTPDQVAAATDSWVGLRLKDLTRSRLDRFMQGASQAGVSGIEETRLVQFDPKVKSGTQIAIRTFAMVLVVIAALAGINLIQNGFLISMSQRTRELSVLSSVGMTRRQKWRMSLTEGVLLYLIGLPIGIGAGYVAMLILFQVLTPLMQDLFFSSSVMRLVWDTKTLVQIALAGFITVMIATLIPAIRSSHRTPLAGVRQHDEIKLSAKALKSPWYVRLFGLEGEIAWKNMRRNRGRYRGTLVALVLSLVLYLSLASLMHYTDYSTQAFQSKGKNDVEIFYNDSAVLSQRDKFESLLKTDGVTSGLAVYSLTGSFDQPVTGLSAPFDQFDIQNYRLFSYDEASLTRLLEQWNMTRADLAGHKAVLINQIRVPKDDGVFDTLKVFDKQPASLDFRVDTLDDSGQPMTIDIVKTVPEGLAEHDFWGHSIKLLVLPETIEELATKYGADFVTGQINILTNPEQHDQVMEDLSAQLNHKGMMADIFNQRQQNQSQRSFIMVAKILFFGFATVLALISLANIYNSLISSLRFRRKEFAMLRSVGMEEKAFRRMIRFESYFYAFKLLIYGIPLGILASVLVHRALSRAATFSFRIPLDHFGLAIGTVVLFLLIVMNLGSRSARRGNILETLKTELDM